MKWPAWGSIPAPAAERFHGGAPSGRCDRHALRGRRPPGDRCRGTSRGRRRPPRPPVRLRGRTSGPRRRAHRRPASPVARSSPSMTELPARARRLMRQRSRDRWRNDCFCSSPAPLDNGRIRPASPRAGRADARRRKGDQAVAKRIRSGAGDLAAGNANGRGSGRSRVRGRFAATAHRSPRRSPVGRASSLRQCAPDPRPPSNPCSTQGAARSIPSCNRRGRRADRHRRYRA